MTCLLSEHHGLVFQDAFIPKCHVSNNNLPTNTTIIAVALFVNSFAAVSRWKQCCQGCEGEGHPSLCFMRSANRGRVKYASSYVAIFLLQSLDITVDGAQFKWIVWTCTFTFKVVRCPLSYSCGVRTVFVSEFFFFCNSCASLTWKTLDVQLVVHHAVLISFCFCVHVSVSEVRCVCPRSRSETGFSSVHNEVRRNASAGVARL